MRGVGRKQSKMENSAACTKLHAFVSGVLTGNVFSDDHHLHD